MFDFFREMVTFRENSGDTILWNKGPSLLLTLSYIVLYSLYLFFNVSVLFVERLFQSADQ